MSAERPTRKRRQKTRDKSWDDIASDDCSTKDEYLLHKLVDYLNEENIADELKIIFNTKQNKPLWNVEKLQKLNHSLKTLKSALQTGLNNKANNLENIYKDHFTYSSLSDVNIDSNVIDPLVAMKQNYSDVKGWIEGDGAWNIDKVLMNLRRFTECLQKWTEKLDRYKLQWRLKLKIKNEERMKLQSKAKSTNKKSKLTNTKTGKKKKKMDQKSVGDGRITQATISCHMDILSAFYTEETWFKKNVVGGIYPTIEKGGFLNYYEEVYKKAEIDSLDEVSDRTIFIKFARAFIVCLF